MGKNNYEIKEYFLDSIPFNLLVLKIPEEELNDKLTYFTDKKGLIPVSLFVDFLIINCVANVNQFLQFLSDVGVDVDLLNKVRKEASDLILLVNDSLCPDNLVLSKNNVVKLYTCDNDSDRKLVDNDWWKLDIYKSKNVAPDEGAQTCNEGAEVIKYELTEMFWTRLNKYIKIKKFTLEEGEELIRNKPFKNRTDYEKYVVTVFIDDVESLFIHLDELGLPSRVSSYILVHELFQLCKSVNSFLPSIQQKDGCGECDDPFGNVVNEEVPNPFKELSKYKNKLRLFKHVEEATLLSIEGSITSKIIGQDVAVGNIVSAIQRASVGLKDPSQPIGTFIFAGPTGIGKTETAKVLADELVGSRQGLVTIDCSEYSADHEYSKLIGTSPGYIGFNKGGYLTNAVKKQPFSVVLFDEIEKASDKVYQLLLQIMDEGRLTDGKGNTVSFKDTVVVMTSNIGVKEVKGIEKIIGFGDANAVTQSKKDTTINTALKKKFRPEFLNRVTSIINFKDLSRKEYLKIIKLELDKLRLNLKTNRTRYSNVTLGFDKSLHNFIYKRGIDTEYGARNLKRAIDREISTPLATFLLYNNINDDSIIDVRVKKSKLRIDLVESKNKDVAIVDNLTHEVSADA